MSGTGKKFSQAPRATVAKRDDLVLIEQDSQSKGMPLALIDPLDDDVPDAAELTGDEVTPLRQLGERRRATAMAHARLAAAKRSGLMFGTVAQAASLVGALNLPIGTVCLVAGYAAAYDGGGSPYTMVATQPSHEGRFFDGARWWELTTHVFRAEMFGAIEDGAGNAHAYAQAGINRAARVNGRFEFLPKTYLIDEPLVVPRPDGPGGVSGEVKRLEIRGCGGDFSDSSTIIKMIAGGDPSAIFASEAWATNGQFYQSSWSIRDVCLDGDNIAQNAIANTAADFIAEHLYIRNIIGKGVLHTRITKDGVTDTGITPDRSEFYRLAIRDCGVGFESLSAGDCTLRDSKIWHCGVCVDVAGAGWQIDNIRTYTQVATEDYVTRLELGQGNRPTNCVFGGASDNPDVYQVELVHKFDPVFFTSNEISGPAGKGIRCRTTDANGRGLITISECTFTNEAGANTCAVWMATNDADFVVDVVDCVFRIGSEDSPFEWESGAEAGQIFSKNCRKLHADGQGVAVIYEGIQRPGALATNNPGVLITAANPLTMTEATKNTVMRDTVLISTTLWKLRDGAGDGQEFELIRSASATGAFDLNVTLSDGTTPVTTLSSAGRRAVVKYVAGRSPPYIVTQAGAMP
jgi:hypothetical protein